MLRGDQRGQATDERDQDIGGTDQAEPPAKGHAGGGYRRGSNLGVGGTGRTKS